MTDQNLAFHLDELEQCVKDALDIQAALKSTPAAKIKVYPNLAQVVNDLFILAQWLEHIVENEEDED
jgi:hypothetical protein